MVITLYHWLERIALIFLMFSFSSVAIATSGPFSSETQIKLYLKEYSEDEISLIKDDLENIRKLCFRNTTPATLKERVYIATAGGPGAGKTTILEEHLRDKKQFVYLDPDQRALKFMINTYLQAFTNDKVNEFKIHTRSDWEKLLEKAYSKWRASSNYITQILLNEAFKNGYNIAHGTTSTSEHVAEIYQKLKENGYKISLLLIYSTDENRSNALQHRTKVQNFVQNTLEDSIKKGKLFAERLPVYFQYADEMNIYWIDHFLESQTLAATLKRGQSMTVHNAEAMKKFTDQYDKDRAGKDLKPLQAYIEAFTESDTKVHIAS